MTPEIEELVKRLQTVHFDGTLLDEAADALKSLSAQVDTLTRAKEKLREDRNAQRSRANRIEMELNLARSYLALRDARISTLEAQLKAFREALEPSAETKALYIGEFSFNVEFGVDAEGNDYSRSITVSWTTTKEIMKAISARAFRSALQMAEKKDD